MLRALRNQFTTKTECAELGAAEATIVGAPIVAGSLSAVMLRDAGEEQTTEGLIERDRDKLNSFVENLESGVSFDDLDDNLKSWWMSRY
jgi:hypothetical protein